MDSAESEKEEKVYYRDEEMWLILAWHHMFVENGVSAAKYHWEGWPNGWEQ